MEPAARRQPASENAKLATHRRELEGNPWRCRDNPSCRLIYGEPCALPPVQRRGPLVRALARTDVSRHADFSFQSMPVFWHTAAGLDLTFFDVVVHMGLGE